MVHGNVIFVRKSVIYHHAYWAHSVLEYSMWCMQVLMVTGNDQALEVARVAAAKLMPDLDVMKGRYHFELESSLRPLEDRLFF